MKDENKSEIPFRTRGIEIYFGHNAFLSPEEKAMQERMSRIYSLKLTLARMTSKQIAEYLIKCPINERQIVIDALDAAITAEKEQRKREKIAFIIILILLMLVMSCVVCVN